ncbi:flagellar basal-body rod protein FlgB [Alteromonas sp. V450]|uniref:flagellar basal body rod protein FlgB n=1 Tax=Alteromonas sp. V450 TaxID=1912139 RepID=UPI0008FF7613|nr:flagellar basal body rod protein FlgB [Alteromonas sp. V450]OJF67326.1 flagellar basal-body rod protein FlgB [Alteromonas sp. V450]|tara:strand:+ start:2337 stop:2771 length:435 start_codon:yes stop_codon:yes gene_type:complete
MAINLDKLVGFHESALKIRTERMEVIAGNLANANTPGYKAKDIDFNRAMQSAMQASSGSASHQASNGLVRTSERHMSGNISSVAANFDMQYRVPTQPDTGDGNTVEVQSERNRFLDNGLRYQASLEFLNGKIKGMKKALSSGGQ